MGNQEGGWISLGIISFSQTSLRNIAPNKNEYPSGNLNTYRKQGYTSVLQIINHSANTSYNMSASPTIVAVIMFPYFVSP